MHVVLLHYQSLVLHLILIITLITTSILSYKLCIHLVPPEMLDDTGELCQAPCSHGYVL